ncbi:hypothetical protein LY76DRAFT_127210 [Colletotrichum caudatum]|nr:hypothetical protein LY76DRAFT_127210 [Colletotrichum caudatum]
MCESMGEVGLLLLLPYIWAEETERDDYAWSGRVPRQTVMEEVSDTSLTSQLSATQKYRQVRHLPSRDCVYTRPAALLTSLSLSSARLRLLSAVLRLSLCVCADRGTHGLFFGGFFLYVHSYSLARSFHPRRLSLPSLPLLDRPLTPPKPFTHVPTCERS